MKRKDDDANQRIKIEMPNGTVHIRRGIGLSVAAAEYPGAWRLTRMDQKPPVSAIDWENDG